MSERAELFAGPPGTGTTVNCPRHGFCSSFRQQGQFFFNGLQIIKIEN
jgi:hypothetical protein